MTETVICYGQEDYLVSMRLAGVCTVFHQSSPDHEQGIRKADGGPLALHGAAGCSSGKLGEKQLENVQIGFGIFAWQKGCSLHFRGGDPQVDQSVTTMPRGSKAASL